MRSPLKSPYLWALVGVVLLVVVAWVGRESYRPVGAGADAPTFTAYDMSGQEVSLRDYRGKVLLVNIWATWCPPCREEMPSMQRLYEELDDPDFEILAVSVDAPQGEEDAFGREGGNLEAFAEAFDLTFSILHDPEGGIQRTYQTTGVPESFIVGRDGVIYKKVAGPTDWDAPVNQELIRRLLDG
jgi:peroxiredoxin